MQEIDVIRATRRFPQQRGLMGSGVLDLFTDAHPTLLGAADLRPFQRFTLACDGFAVLPDLVCRLADGESLVAVEARGGADLLRGSSPCWRHFRSTTFLQYKSVLKHAGIVAPHALGGASARSYDPDRDIWELTLPSGEAP